MATCLGRVQTLRDAQNALGQREHAGGREVDAGRLAVVLFEEVARHIGQRVDLMACRMMLTRWEGMAEREGEKIVRTNFG